MAPIDKSLISICIPVHNGERFIEEALNSIVLQNYENKEIIVSDNVSMDSTPEIVQRYVRDYGVKYFRSESFLPAAEYNFNRCIELARGDLISVYHADDIYNPEIISRSEGILGKYGNVGAVLTMANRIDEKGRLIGRYYIPKELKRLKKDFYNFEEIFGGVLKYGNSFLICSSAMIRKSAYKESGPWNYERYKIAADLGLWLKIAQRYDISIINSPLMDYRISAGQNSKILKRRTDKTHYFLVMDEYASKIRGHEFERYYDVHKIADLTDRALNLSANLRIRESDSLIKDALLLYCRSFFKIGFVVKTLECLAAVIFLFFVNRLPRDLGKRSFRNFVFKLKDLRRTLFFI